MKGVGVFQLGPRLAALVVVFALAVLAPLAAAGRSTSASAARAVPTAHVTRAPLMKMPGVTIPPEWEWGDYSGVDSNSPVIWRDGKLHMYNSCCGMVYHSSGANLYGLGGSGQVEFDKEVDGSRWMESVVTADNGTLYGFYHFEPNGICPGQGKRPIWGLTAPQIGLDKKASGGSGLIDRGGTGGMTRSILLGPSISRGRLYYAQTSAGEGGWNWRRYHSYRLRGGAPKHARAPGNLISHARDGSSTFYVRSPIDVLSSSSPVPWNCEWADDLAGAPAA